MKPTRKILAVGAVASIAAVLGFVSLQGPQDNKSWEFQKKLIEALTVGEPVPLFSLIDKEVLHSATVCILGPYQDARDYVPPQARDGLESWLTWIDEKSIAVVVLNDAGKTSEVVRLNRLKIDIRPYGWPSRCFQRGEDPRMQFDQYESDRRMLVLLKSGSVSQ